MSKILITLALFFSAAFAMAEPDSDSIAAGDQEAVSRGWRPWYRMVFTATSDPAACTAGNWTYLVVRGTDNTVYYRVRSQATGGWSNWNRVSTMKTNGAPAIACTYYSSSNFKVDVFIAHTNGNLYHFPNNSGTWGSAENLGGVVDYGSGPAATSDVVGNHLEVFVRGTDQTLFRKYRYYGTWSNWERVSTPMKSDPGAAMWNQGHFDIFAVTPSYQLWSRFWEGNIWYAPRVHAGVITSSPDAVSRGQGLLDVFARGPSNQMLWKNQVNGVWSGWTSLGGNFVSGPGATAYANNTRMLLFAKGSDGYLWYRSWIP